MNTTSIIEITNKSLVICDPYSIKEYRVTLPIPNGRYVVKQFKLNNGEISHITIYDIFGQIHYPSIETDLLNAPRIPNILYVKNNIVGIFNDHQSVKIFEQDEKPIVTETTNYVTAKLNFNGMFAIKGIKEKNNLIGLLIQIIETNESYDDDFEDDEMEDEDE